MEEHDFNSVIPHDVSDKEATIRVNLAGITPQTPVRTEFRDGNLTIIAKVGENVHSVEIKGLTEDLVEVTDEMAAERSGTVTLKKLQKFSLKDKFFSKNRS